MRKPFNPRVGFVERPAPAAQHAPLSLIALSIYRERDIAGLLPVRLKRQMMLVASLAPRTRDKLTFFEGIAAVPWVRPPQEQYGSRLTFGR
jgi:hypothetical protein